MSCRFHGNNLACEQARHANMNQLCGRPARAHCKEMSEDSKKSGGIEIRKMAKLLLSLQGVYPCEGYQRGVAFRIEGTLPKKILNLFQCLKTLADNFDKKRPKTLKNTKKNSTNFRANFEKNLKPRWQKKHFLKNISIFKKLSFIDEEMLRLWIDFAMCPQHKCFKLWLFSGGNTGAQTFLKVH